jgi:hypothetical protein
MGCARGPQSAPSPFGWGRAPAGKTRAGPPTALGTRTGAGDTPSPSVSGSGFRQVSSGRLRPRQRSGASDMHRTMRSLNAAAALRQWQRAGGVSYRMVPTVKEG